MATKKVQTYIKLQCPAGAATPAPPIAPALGPHDVPAPKFVQEFNAGGKARFLATRAKEADHLLCKVGAELRKMMSWLKK